jgi:hypothetical protein
MAVISSEARYGFASSVFCSMHLSSLLSRVARRLCHRPPAASAPRAWPRPHSTSHQTNLPPHPQSQRRQKIMPTINLIVQLERILGKIQDRKKFFQDRKKFGKSHGATINARAVIPRAIIGLRTVIPSEARNLSSIFTRRKMRSRYAVSPLQIRRPPPVLHMPHSDIPQAVRNQRACRHDDQRQQKRFSNRLRVHNVTT